MLPTQADAADFRSDSYAVVGPGETIDDDLYIAGNTVEILGNVRGDVFAAGQTIIVQGNVEGGLTAAGSSIVVNGQVGRGARLAGNSVSVTGRTERDLLAFAGKVSVDNEAMIGGDLQYGGGSLVMSGDVGRDLRGSGGAIDIDGRVGRNVELSDTSSFRLGENARILGSLAYSGAKEGTISTGARVGDNRGFTPVPREQPATNPVGTAINLIWGVLRSFLGLAVLGLLLVWLLPRPIERARQALAEAPAQSFGIGCVTLLLAPPVVLTLLVLGILLGTVQLPAVLTALITVGVSVAGVIVGLEIGELLLRATGSKAPVWLEALIGAAVLTVLGALPVVGWIFTGISAVLGFGAILYALQKEIRSERSPSLPTGVMESQQINSAPGTA
jgi:hypothetical protein